MALEIPEILSTLAKYTGYFPREAVEQAIARKEEITPYFLRALEEVASAPNQEVDEESMLPLYAAYLLAQFREKAAYQPLLKIAGFPEKKVEALFGDTITEGLERIIASIFDGNIDPLIELILNRNAGEFARGAGIDALLTLVSTDQVPRETMVEHFRNLFARLEKESGQVWNALCCAVGYLPAPELLEQVRQAYAEGLGDPIYSSYEDIAADVERPPGTLGQGEAEERHLVEDAIEEMSWWAAFSDGEGEGDYDEEIATAWRENVPVEYTGPTGPPLGAASPYVRSEPKVGRNDPCPCGSGKKYKKCCLASEG